MENINVAESIQKLPIVAEDNNKRISGDVFGKYSAIYIAPTSNIKDSVNLLDTDNYDNALVVGANGAYINELLLKGIKTIDAFDINVYQYYFYELIQAGIKLLSYEDFINCFCAKKIGPKQQDLSNMFDISRIEFIVKIIDGEAGEFWDFLLDVGLSPRELLTSNLFRKGYYLLQEHLQKFSSVYDVNKYYELQKILLGNDYRIDYRISGIEEVAQEFKGRKYDIIAFDNILQYYRRLPSLNNVYKVNSFIQNDVVPMLNVDGTVQVSYGFEIPSDAVSKMKKRVVNRSIQDQLLLQRNSRVINHELKEGIIPSLLKKYDGYDYDFIPGVETDPDINHKSDNIVLSYVRRQKCNE